MKRIALAFMVALLAAAPVAAQEHEGHPPKDGEHEAHGQMHGQPMHGQHEMPGHAAGMQMGQGGGHCMAMMAGLGQAMMAFHHPEALGLTADQTQELESLMTRTHEAAHPHMQMAMEAGARAGELLEAERPDLAAYEERLEEAAAHMIQAHTAMARATVEARGLLTPEQRTRLSGMDHEMGAMPCPMMHGKADAAAGAAHDNH